MHPYPSLYSMKNSTENLHTNVRVQRVKIPNGKNSYCLQQLSKRPAHNHAKIQLWCVCTCTRKFQLGTVFRMKNQISLESNEIQAHMLANSHSEIRPKCGLIRAKKVLFFVLFCSCQENLLTLDNQSGLYDKVFYFLLLIFFPNH